MKRRHAILLMGSAALCRVRAESTKPTPLRFERALMGTRFAIDCHAEAGDALKQAVDAAFARAEKINEVASDYIADSELLGISKRPAGTAVKVSPLLFQLLLEARDFADKTHGLFDPTFGPLTHLWRESRRRNVLPDATALTEARAACGWNDLQLDATNLTVTLHKPNMRLDLGGIAKGQAADAMFDEMKSRGFSHTCIAAGGDLRVGDAPPDTNGWQVGVKTFDKTTETRTLTLVNQAVSTSGSLFQHVDIDGVSYSHIIDPATGLGLTRRVAASVISPRSTISDALATACCIAANAEEARSMALAAGATEIFVEA